MEIAFFAENRDAIALLQESGCEVQIVPGQGCCGAVHSHAGESSLTHQQARRNIAAFEAADMDYVVNAAGGCGAALKEYRLWLKQDPVWRDRAALFSVRVKDIAEILAELDNLPLGDRPGRITYQDSCHLRNVQKVVHPPRKLLRRIPRAEFVELPGSEECCGAGGIYNLLHPETAGQMGDEKVRKVGMTASQTVVVANPPCQLQLRASLRRKGLEGQGIEVQHLVRVLRQSVEAGRRAAHLAGDMADQQAAD